MDPTIPFQWTEPMALNGSNASSYPACDIQYLDFLIIITAPAGLAGNMIVLWFLGFWIRKNAISVYILNLAVADFFFLCCLIICSLLSVISNSHPFSLHIHGILSNVAMVPYVAGLSILSAISTERCMSVLWPIWYRCRRPRHLSSVMCALLWALSLLLNILEWSVSGFLTHFFDDDWWRKVDFVITAWLMILFATLSVSSLALLVRMFCGSQRMPLTRLYVTVLVTVLVFLICGLPFGIYWFFVCWLPIYFDHVFCHLYPVTVFLSCVNSCANPIVYFFVGSFRRWRKRQTLKVILQRALRDTPEDECGNGLPQEPQQMSGSTSEQ